VTPTDEPGLYIVDVFLPQNATPGQYIMVIESQIPLVLPDGSTETFYGKDMVDIWI
jgi:hypothetical protein